MALALEALTRAVKMAIVRMRLLFITSCSFAKRCGLDVLPDG